MKTINIYTTLLGVAVLSAALVGHAGRHAVLAKAPAHAALLADAWKIPPEVNGGALATQDDYYEFGWQSFIALNWPALAGKRGDPDATKPIGATGPDGTQLPAVWQTYKDPSEVFLPGAKPPPPWDSPPTAQTAKWHIPSGGHVLTMASMSTPAITGSLAQAGFPYPDVKAVRGPLIDQNRQYVWFEIRLNRPEFDYIDSNKYYNSDIQVAAVNAKTFKVPPGTDPNADPSDRSIELKACWRILDPKKDIISRYFHQEAWIITGGHRSGPYTIGLVGLHILRLTPVTRRTWFWASFEQVDNVKIDGVPPTRPDGKSLTPSFNPGTAQPKQFPSGYSYEPALPDVVPGKPPPPPGPPVDVWRAIQIPERVDYWNSVFGLSLSRTVFRYYKMVGVMNPWTTTSPAKPDSIWVPYSGTDPAYVNIRNMSNVTIETYLQAGNCVTCHGYGHPQGDNLMRGKYQILTFLLNYAQKPATASIGTHNSSEPRRAKVAARSMRRSPG